MHLLKQNLKSTISMSSGFMFLGILLIVWLAMSLLISRVEHNKKHKSKEIKMKQSTDNSGQEKQFQQTPEEFKGLFEEDSVQLEQQEE